MGVPVRGDAKEAQEISCARDDSRVHLGFGLVSQALKKHRLRRRPFGPSPPPQMPRG